MIKRLIFDLDNTLIMWKDSYNLALKNTIDHYHLNVDYLEVNKVTLTYEDYYDRYDKQYMVDLINSNFNLNISIDFIDYWLEQLKDMYEIDEKLIDLLEYLSSKYELVILTNWFKVSQYERIKKANIDKYFKEIITAEEICKPHQDAFYKAIKPYDVKEVIMIGDNYKIDIEPALKLGIKTIMVSKEKREDTITINNIYKLKEML